MEAFETWEEEWRRKAENPDYVPKLGGKYLSDYEAQFLDYVTENLAEHYICRVPKCAFVGRNCDWVTTASPAAGTTRAPGAGRGTSRPSPGRTDA
eukprot:2468876-Alexandrium_andersonii.AAC.1